MATTKSTSADKSTSRVGKRQLLSSVAERADVDRAVVERVYGALLSSIVDLVREHGRLSLFDFGSFYSQRHKGHRVQFSKGDSDRIPDYTVLKFSAARKTNKRMATDEVLE